MKIKVLILRIFRIIPDGLFNRLMFIIKLGYIPNLKKPRSLNEKINHIKLYSNYDLRETVADRVKVRNYVKSKKTNCELIDLLWEGKDFKLSDYNNLPNNFVIKANHGSGMVTVVDKTKTSYNELLKIITPWLDYDYGKLTRQWVYKDLEKKFVVEEFIETKEEKLYDYKFFCINGHVELIQVDIDRFDGHRRNLYTRDFNLMDIEYLYEKGNELKEPELFKTALEVAEKLSSDFDFIRVDLYILKDVIYFGEMTNTPENGYGSFKPQDFDFVLGEKLILKEGLS